MSTEEDIQLIWKQIRGLATQQQALTVAHNALVDVLLNSSIAKVDMELSQAMERAKILSPRYG